MSKKSSDFYYLGLYEEAASCVLNRTNAPYILASLCFRGEHDQARRIYKEYRRDLSLQELVFTGFHLGLSYTRTSEYDLAQKTFIDSWKLRHHPLLSPIEKFFIYQGLSFFRFFFSRHYSSLLFAKKALGELSKAETEVPLLKALVNDLMAHNYFQLGRPAKGESFLIKANNIAKKNKFPQLREEFEASLIIYKSSFDPHIEKNISDLKKLLKRTSESNDYTSSELVLQISKLKFLKGDYKKANDFLIQNFNTIYKKDNKRKVAKLNTLLAQLLLPRGQRIEALSLLKVAKSNLDKSIDGHLLAPILGLEISILESLNQDFSEQRKELAFILKKTDKGLLHQIQARSFNGQPLYNEEDRIGILFDQASMGKVEAIDDILEYQILHLIPRLAKGLQKKRAIILHPKSLGLFLIHEDRIVFCEGKLSKSQINFLDYLIAKPRTKEELVVQIWGYDEYDPIRHDHLVYTMVRRLRKQLGPYSEWIFSSGEDSYSIDRDVQFIRSLFSDLPDQRKASSAKEQELPVDLNFRQVQLLEGAFDRPFSAGEVAEYFKITRMTSYRDLDELVSKGLLVKRGKSRGTRYDLP